MLNLKVTYDPDTNEVTIVATDDSGNEVPVKLDIDEINFFLDVVEKDPPNVVAFTITEDRDLDPKNKYLGKHNI